MPPAATPPRPAATLALAALAAMLWAGLACTARQEPFDLLTPAELARSLVAADLRVFDATSPPAYARGRVPGATLVDFVEFTAGELPADKATRVVFYCKNRH